MADNSHTAADPGPNGAHARLDLIFRAERGRILATLIAILRDFELAEEAFSDAVSAALTAGPRAPDRRAPRGTRRRERRPGTARRPGPLPLGSAADPRGPRHGRGGAAPVSPNPGSFALQAAIAGEHARATRAEDTDWGAIVALYDRLAVCEPTPVVKLNRAVAVAEAHGLERALPLVDALAAEGGLERYHLLHVARGELLARLGRNDDAVRALEHAASLAPTAPERRFLASRIAALSGPE